MTRPGQNNDSNDLQKKDDSGSDRPSKFFEFPSIPGKSLISSGEKTAGCFSFSKNPSKHPPSTSSKRTRTKSETPRVKFDKDVQVMHYSSSIDISFKASLNDPKEGDAATGGWCEGSRSTRITSPITVKVKTKDLAFAWEDVDENDLFKAIDTYVPQEIPLRPKGAFRRQREKDENEESSKCESEEKEAKREGKEKKDGEGDVIDEEKHIDATLSQTDPHLLAEAGPSGKLFELPPPQVVGPPKGKRLAGFFNIRNRAATLPIDKWKKKREKVETAKRQPGKGILKKSRSVDDQQVEDLIVAIPSFYIV